ncbi:phosphotransferase family protein [Paenibacillus sp. 481]|uniref:phosphotransferase family protein n=1 Tax=Paenibacillus sp. 481 TaxID=2835869 RepID=UPI001E29AA91|nr:aminoglycoside phosphotransferase family protein [Paenibacillus sp. 481]UHA75449.1 aminoglycoside phosphotransferase family protein [Paenibacillus sp. 481]
MVTAYVERIQEVYPDLHIYDVEPNNIGQNNDVLIVSKSLVFRFPKHAPGVEQLKRETDLLKLVGSIVTLPVPDPTYQSFDNMEVGKAFMGYRFIEGAPFWKQDLLDINNPDAEHAIALQLVTFLMQIHAIDTQAVAHSQEECENIHDMMSKLFSHFQEKLFPFMRVEAQHEVSNNFTTFLSNPHNRNIKQTFIHGDFGTGNIIWSPEECTIAGVIDFGGSGLGDPAYDFAGILAGYGEDFFEKCIRLYPNGREIAERVHFYRSTFALQEALHGVEHDDVEAFENGIKEYR